MRCGFAKAEHHTADQRRDLNAIAVSRVNEQRCIDFGLEEMRDMINDVRTKGFQLR